MAYPILEPSSDLAAPLGPVVLLILDGVGIGAGDQYDAVATARTPTLDRLRDEGLTTSLLAHGTAVGLPSDSDIGNSEVGHNIMGAGRIFPQGATSVGVAFEQGTIWDGCWQEMVDQVQDQDGTLHLIGLLSDGNVHSHIDHLYQFIDRAAEENIQRVRVHVLFDGRDVPDHTAQDYVAPLEERLAATGRDYRIASGGGRMAITMDRYEADWDMVAAGWQVHVLGQGRQFSSALEALEVLREEEPDVSDQNVPGFVIAEDGEAVGTIVDGDAVILFNFRGDRAVELCRAFEADDDFDKFDRQRRPDVLFAGMTQYDGDLNIPERFLVQPQKIDGTVSERLVRAGLRQFAASETQKYGHVTYFWNGNRSDKFDDVLETWLEIPSDRVSFDQRPWMKAAELADAVIVAVASGQHDFIRANFANGDMVGHTGHFEATVVAMEALDLCLQRIEKAVRKARGCLVVTADHGNAEDMVERRDGEPVLRDGRPRWRTAHSANPVPLIVRDYSDRALRLDETVARAGLANLAATVIRLLGFRPPDDFEPSLIQPAN